jgi:hypothetical protein
MLVSTSVPTLVGGVSQQAENLRFTSQCTEQVNGFCSLLRGLVKRPHTTLKAYLGTIEGAFSLSAINRSATEQYALFLGDESCSVRTLDGAVVPVKAADGSDLEEGDLAYLATSSPKSDLRAVTVADYTVLLNRSKVTALTGTATEDEYPGALFFVKQYKANVNYTLKLFDTVEATTPSWTVNYYNTDAATTTQMHVAAGLRSLLQSSGAHALYDHFSVGPSLFLSKKDGSQFRIETACDVPDYFFGFKDSVQNFSLLPKMGWAGFSIKVAGNPDDAGDDYYVQYVSTSPAAIGFCEGTWEESQLKGLYDTLDHATMPHALVNHGTHFRFTPLTWGTRQAGDATSNPAPSFVGKKLNDVIFHRNRLGLLADENLVLSESGEFFNYWRTSVIQLLDSDPIDIASSNAKVSILNSAVAANKSLVLFSEQTQFELQAGDLLTPKTASLPAVSDYENTVTVSPKALGDSIVFPFKRGGYSGFLDYDLDPDTAKWRGIDITEHVPAYIAGTVESFDVSALHGLLLAKADAQNTLYVYQYFKRRTERLQSAWHRWEFNGILRGFFLLGSTLYLVLQYGTECYLETMNVDVTATDQYTDFTTLLDRRMSRHDAGVYAVYHADTDTTDFSMPYEPDPAKLRVVRKATATVGGGEVVPILSCANNVFTVRGNLGSYYYWFGETYTMSVTLTRPQLRASRSDGTAVILPGRFQVRRGTLSFANSLAFSVTVAPKDRSTFTYAYAPRSLGTSTALTGSVPPLQSGEFRFPVNSKSDQVTITLVNDTPLPCALLALDWTASYTQRAQRL